MSRCNMNKRNIKFIYSYTKPYIGIWTLGILFTIVSSFLQIKYAWLIRDLIDNALLPKNFDLLFKLCVTFFLLVVTCSIFSFIKELCFNYVSQKSIVNIRMDLFQHILKLPYDFFVKTEDGEIVNRLVNDVKNTQDAFSDHIVSLITSFITSVLITTWLLVVNWKLAILFLVIVPIFCGATKVLWKKISKLSHKAAEDTGRLTGFFQEAISSIEMIKIIGNPYFTKKLTKLCKSLSNSIIKLRMSMVFNNSLWESILTPYQAVFYLIGGYWYIKYNEPSIGIMLVFVNLVGVLVPNVLTFIGAISQMANGVASLDRIQKLFDHPIEQGGKKLLSSEKEICIEFKNVCFKYQDTGFSIKDINLTINNNEFVTIVGHTGSGKSTLLKLLIRLYDVDSGEILINGANINDYDISDLRSCFGFLQQDMYLIKGSLRDNLLLANEAITDAQIDKAIQLTQLKGYIESLPNKIDTIIGERGITLSGGEKQRLSLTRMLICGLNKIVIMDEPTSALDLSTEQRILNDMRTIFEHRTTIVIDHRLATLNLASKIVVMKNGTIAEMGTYDELLEQDGELCTLVNARTVS